MAAPPCRRRLPPRLLLSAVWLGLLVLVAVFAPCSHRKTRWHKT